MSAIVIGIGDVKTSNMPGSVLKTFALGSCIGVAVLAPCKLANNRPAAGLLHIALPDSTINQKLALERPAYFADTGIPILIKQMLDYGYQYSDLIIKIAGGANMMDPENRFNIGGRNVIAVKKYLWRYKLGAVKEDVGDSISRTMTIDLDAARMSIASPGKGEWEL